MSTIIFYTEQLQSNVENFVEDLRKNEPSKGNNFITFDEVSRQTKITFDSDEDEIVSAIITLTTMAANIFLFVPYQSLIRSAVKSYIDKNSLNVTYKIYSVESDKKIKPLKGESDDIFVVKDSYETPLSYEEFVPRIRKVLYLLPTAVAKQRIKNATDKTIYTVDDVKLKQKLEIPEKDKIGIIIPQLSCASWIDLIESLNYVFNESPVDYVYFASNDWNDHHDINDFFMNMINTMLSEDITYSSLPIPTIFGEDFINISEKQDDEEIPTVEAEEVNVVE